MNAERLLDQLRRILKGAVLENPAFGGPH